MADNEELLQQKYANNHDFVQKMFSENNKGAKNKMMFACGEKQRKKLMLKCACFIQALHFKSHFKQFKYDDLTMMDLKYWYMLLKPSTNKILTTIREAFIEVLDGFGNGFFTSICNNYDVAQFYMVN